MKFSRKKFYLQSRSNIQWVNRSKTILPSWNNSTSLTTLTPRKMITSSAVRLSLSTGQMENTKILSWISWMNSFSSQNKELNASDLGQMTILGTKIILITWLFTSISKSLCDISSKVCQITIQWIKVNQHRSMKLRKTSIAKKLNTTQPIKLDGKFPLTPQNLGIKPSEHNKSKWKTQES